MQICARQCLNKLRQILFSRAFDGHNDACATSERLIPIYVVPCVDAFAPELLTSPWVDKPILHNSGVGSFRSVTLRH